MIFKHDIFYFFIKIDFVSIEYIHKSEKSFKQTLGDRRYPLNRLKEFYERK